jgi:hypothetical protein
MMDFHFGLRLSELEDQRTVLHAVGARERNGSLFVRIRREVGAPRPDGRAATAARLHPKPKSRHSPDLRLAGADRFWWLRRSDGGD